MWKNRHMKNVFNKKKRKDFIFKNRKKTSKINIKIEVLVLMFKIIKKIEIMRKKRINER